jgi:hypothetical protein
VESRHKGAPGLWKGEGALSFFEYDAGTPLPEAERRPRPYFPQRLCAAFFAISFRRACAGIDR